MDSLAGEKEGGRGDVFGGVFGVAFLVGWLAKLDELVLLGIRCEG